jgi:hypothetical protein
MVEPEATGTLAEQNEFMSDTPTDIKVICIRFAMTAKAIAVIGKDLFDKLKETPEPILAKELEEQAIAQVEALNRELERLLEAKRRWEEHADPRVARLLAAEFANAFVNAKVK